MTEEAKRTDIWRVPFSNIRVLPGFNIRTDYGDVLGLRDSIREHGVKVPLQGWREGELFFVKEGFRRYEAMALLYKEGIEIICPFILEPKHYNPERRIVDMFVMNDGKRLTPIEQANGILRLMNYGWKDADIAKAVNMHINYVQRLTGLLATPQRFQDVVHKGDLAATLAMDIIQKGEVTEFLQKYDAGEFATDQVTGDGVGIRKKRITASSLGRVNSWGAFKKYAKNNPGDLLPPHKAEFYQFLCRMRRNEITPEEIDNFFKI